MKGAQEVMIVLPMENLKPPHSKPTIEKEKEPKVFS